MLYFVCTCAALLAYLFYRRGKRPVYNLRNPVYGTPENPR